MDMTTGAITTKLFRLSWPLVVGNVLQTAYNLADMIWVGRVSAEAVAAVSLMFPMTFLFISVAMGLTAASVALVSQHVGAGEERAAENTVAQTVLLATGLAFVIAVSGYAFRHELVWLIGARNLVFDLSLDYLEVILVSIPFTFLFFAFRSVLRAAGDTKTAMWLMVFSAGLNVVIDPFFVLSGDPFFGFEGPFLGLGVRGAALATLISRVLATAVGMYVLLDGSWGIRLRIRDLRPDLPVLRKLVDIGYPATIDGLARSLAAVAFAAIVARFGPIPTAAYGIALRMMSVSWTVSGAVGQAVATGVGQNLGARIPDRAAEVTWKGTGGSMALLFAVGAAAFVFPDVAMWVFIADAAVIEEGVTLLRIVAPFWAFMGGLMVVQGAFRGAGDTRQAMVLSFLSRWIFRIPVALVLAYPLAMAEIGLWWSLAASGTITFFVGVVWFNLGRWQEGVVEGGGPGPSPTPANPGTDPDADVPAED